MTVCVAVGEARSRLSHHRQIKRGLNPIRAAAHLGKPRVAVDSWIVQLSPAVPTGLHGEKMFECESLFSRIEFRGGTIRKEAQEGLLYISNDSLLNGQADEGRRD